MNGIAGVFGDDDKKSVEAILDIIQHRDGEEQTLLSGSTFVLGMTGAYRPSLERDNYSMVLDVNCGSSVVRDLPLEQDFSTTFDYRQLLADIDKPFALALANERNLALARGPYGIKPLYFVEKENKIYFASEFKALTKLSSAEVPVRSVPAGGIYCSGKGQKKYFFLETPEEFSGSVAEIGSHLREKLKEAVADRMKGKEKIGLLVSGGLDSSIIAALATEMADQKLDSFAVGIEGSSDLEKARKVAEHLGTNHHQYIYSQEEMMEVLPEVIYYQENFDAPLIRSSIPNYLAARLARENGVEVLFSGEGADELFGGYHYLADLVTEEFNDEILHLLEKAKKGALQRVDRMNSAHGIECRLPFLDREVVEFALSIPPRFKLDGGRGDIEKWILREAFKDYLPDEIIERKKAQFGKGSGSIDLCRQLEDLEEVEYGENKIHLQHPDDIEEEFNSRIRSEEEFYYYQIFRYFYPEYTEQQAGRWFK